MPICLGDVEDHMNLPELEPERPAGVYAGQEKALPEDAARQIAELFSFVWVEPNRHLMAMSLSGILAKEGYSQGSAEDLIYRVCAWCSDPEKGNRIQAVRDTYLSAANGQPVMAWRTMAELLPPDTLDYFRGLVDAHPVPESSDPPEDDDPYAVPFRLTVRQDFPTYHALMAGLLPSDPRGVVGYLAGLSQSFKSYLALDWGCHVSEGMTWHGHETTKAQVLYVCAEGQYSDLLSRLRAWECHNIKKAESLYCRLSPINLFEPKSVERSLDLIDKARDFEPRLVILDTLSQCAGQMMETSNDDARTIYRACKEFGKRFGSTVLIVHHAGKAENAIMRGASALFDDADFVHQLVRPNWQANGMDCTLNAIKMKSERRVRGHDMQAIEVEWQDGAERGKDLVLVQRVLASLYNNVPNVERI